MGAAAAESGAAGQPQTAAPGDGFPPATADQEHGERHRENKDQPAGPDPNPPSFRDPEPAAASSATAMKTSKAKETPAAEGAMQVGVSFALFYLCMFSPSCLIN